MDRKSAYHRRSLWEDVWKRIRHNNVAVFGIVLFLIIVALCFMSPLFYDYTDDILAVDTANALQGFSKEHWLGTDELGRDVLARILWGGRNTLMIAFGGMAIGISAGTVLGSAAAYYGRFTDTIIMRIVDVIMSIPPLVLMIAIATVLPPSRLSLVLVIGLGFIPGMSRTIRAQVLGVIGNEYIEAVRIQGASDFKIITGSILPNAISPIITTLIMDIAFAVGIISTLSFMGLGVQPPDPEWGTMLASGRQYLRTAWHITTLPGIALVVTVIALTLVGDGMRDALDPRMKR